EPGPLVEVEGLTKRFPITQGVIFQKQIGAVHAVEQVTLSIDRGETLGVVGGSGCGQPTPARLITPLLEPTEGTVSFDGQDISHLRRRELRPLRRQMQMVFQDPYGSLKPPPALA